MLAYKLTYDQSITLNYDARGQQQCTVREKVAERKAKAFWVWEQLLKLENSHLHEKNSNSFKKTTRNIPV